MKYFLGLLGTTFLASAIFVAAWIAQSKAHSKGYATGYNDCRSELPEPDELN